MVFYILCFFTKPTKHTVFLCIKPVPSSHEPLAFKSSRLLAFTCCGEFTTAACIDCTGAAIARIRPCLRFRFSICLMLCAKYGFGPSDDFVAQTSDQSFCAIILGSRTQTSDPRICCANLGSARNTLGSRNQTSAIHGNKPTIDRARRAARPSASTKPQSIVHVCVRDRSWVCCHG